MDKKSNKNVIFQLPSTSSKPSSDILRSPKKSLQKSASFDNDSILKKNDAKQVCSTKEKSDKIIGGPVGDESSQIKKISTPAQDKSIKTLEILRNQLKGALMVRDSGLFIDGTSKNKICDLQNQIKVEEKHLVKLKKDIEKQKRYREKIRNSLICYKSQNKEQAKDLKIRDKPGRTPVEEDQPGLHQAILDIALFGSAADSRRRAEVINNVTSVSSLTDQLNSLGFKISRSATYLRLIPKNSNTIEGKKHISTVPVKMRRAQNEARKNHLDTYFCTASIRAAETLASVLGPKQVFFLSSDDKARVPIGITAAKKQAPFLMHVEYRVTLPDHDWVVAKKHKLIPSVYAVIEIAENKFGDPSAVSYSGPTYIAIRSGKHSSSNASTHALDFKKLTSLKEFQELAKTEDGQLKPVVMISTDGGPDENPRYPSVISFAVQTFSEFDLDALFVFTNAPGHSAYNRVERRMAPLSHQLSGLLIPYDSFGNHLDFQNRTIDESLEKQNFEKAGNILADVWSSMKIDKFDVLAEYINPEQSSSELKTLKNDIWYAKHVRESQYFLQIVKCNDAQCCSKQRSNIRDILPDGFLPPPHLLHQSSSGIVIPTANDKKSKFAPLLLNLASKIKPKSDEFKIIPYDFHCPSIQEALNNRICKICGIYFASNKSMLNHKKSIHINLKEDEHEKPVKIRPERVAARRAKELLCIMSSENEEVDWLDEDDVILDKNNNFLNSEESSAIKITEIESIPTWLTSPWIEDDLK